MIDLYRHWVGNWSHMYGVIHYDYVWDDRDDLACLDIMVGFWEAMLRNDSLWIKVVITS